MVCSKLVAQFAVLIFTLSHTSGAIPPDVRIDGVLVDLPNGWNNNAEQTINDARETIATTDPFEDNSLIPQLGDGEEEVGVVRRDND